MLAQTHLTDLLGRQLERHRPQVIAQPLLFPARRHGHDVLVDTPPQQHLARIHRILLRQTRQDLVTRPRRAFRHGREGSVGLGGDALGSVEVEQAFVLEVRVEFDLVDGWPGLGGLENPFEVLLEVVADADGPRQALGLHFFHLRPFLLVLGFVVGEERGVDEIPASVDISRTS